VSSQPIAAAAAIPIARRAAREKTMRTMLTRGAGPYNPRPP
jgi:hypothetical protein